MAWDIIHVNHAKLYALFNGGKKLAESEDNLSNIETEDEEITPISYGIHTKNTIRATKNTFKTFLEAVGDVKEITDREMLDKRLAKFNEMFVMVYFPVYHL